MTKPNRNMKVSHAKKKKSFMTSKVAVVGSAQKWSPACTQNLGSISIVSSLVVKLACGTDMAETAGSPPAEAFIPINTNVKQCLRSPRG